MYVICVKIFACTSEIHAFAQASGKGVRVVIIESADNQKVKINLHAQHNPQKSSDYFPSRSPRSTQPW